MQLALHELIEILLQHVFYLLHVFEIILQVLLYFNIPAINRRPVVRWMQH